MVGFVLNPPRKHRRHKARRSHRRGRRRNAKGFFTPKHAAGHRGRKIRHTLFSIRKNPRRRRRRNPPAAFYALNRRRRSHHRKGRRRRNPPAAFYALNRRRRSHHRKGRRHRNPMASMGGMISAVPQVIPFRVPLPGILGKVANGIVQGTAAGTVVFGGMILSSYLVNPIDKKMHKTGADGSSVPVLGKFQRPLLFGAVAGLSGTGMRFAAKLVKGNPLLWFILGAAGPGLAAIASVIDSTVDRQKAQESGGITYRILKVATGLSDYIQMGDEAIEAGVGDEAIEAGVGENGDYIQIGDEEDEMELAEDVA